jgi:hypothetical protein
MAEIVPKQCKTPINQSINQSTQEFFTYMETCVTITGGGLLQTIGRPYHLQLQRHVDEELQNDTQFSNIIL